MAKQDIKISTIDDFKKSQFSYIKLDNVDEYGEDLPLTLKIKRVSMQSMIQSGMLPNNLLAEAQSLATKKPVAQTKAAMEKADKYINMMHEVAKEIMVEPRYDEVKEYLTEDHVAALFNIVTGGVEALRRFRANQKSTKRNITSK